MLGRFTLYNADEYVIYGLKWHLAAILKSALYHVHSLSVIRTSVDLKSTKCMRTVKTRLFYGGVKTLYSTKWHFGHGPLVEKCRGSKSVLSFFCFV